ncbi:MAG: phosphotransferase family protein [Acidimicrobiales bacterium]|nr:phosphotransferase family protein [Acidimicrobiales bacterium]
MTESNESGLTGNVAAVDPAELAAWLLPRLDGATAIEVEAFEPPRSGYSAETSVFTAHVDRETGPGPEKFVLRRESPEPPVYPQQSDRSCEVEIQYRVMECVAASSDVPIAPLYGFEADPSVLDAEFFVMGFVDGDVPVEDPIYTSAGFFVDATDEQRARLVTAGVETMAAIHAIDWRAAGLDWLTPDGVTAGTRRQFDLWHDYYRREIGDRVHPRVEEAITWLDTNMPDDAELALSWGDPRPGNIIWSDFSPACVTDFEAASISPPVYDLGWWLMFDHWSHETMGQPRLPGEPTRDEQATHYAAVSGRSIDNVRYYELFAAMRYCAIVVRVINRMVERGHMPADHTIWLENPASTCLDLLMTDYL